MANENLWAGVSRRRPGFARQPLVPLRPRLSRRTLAPQSRTPKLCRGGRARRRRLARSPRARNPRRARAAIRFSGIRGGRGVHSSSSRGVDSAARRAQAVTRSSAATSVAMAFRLWLRDEIDVLDARARDARRRCSIWLTPIPRPVTPATPPATRAAVLFAHGASPVEMLALDRSRSRTRAAVNLLPLARRARRTSYKMDPTGRASSLGFGQSPQQTRPFRPRSARFAAAASLVMFTSRDSRKN